MREVYDHGWYTSNEIRKYPLDSSASGYSDKGEELPPSLIVDIKLVSGSYNTYYIGGVSCSEHIISVVIHSVDSRGAKELAAALTVPQPVDPYTHYAFESFDSSVHGVITFGHVDNYGQWSFSSPEQSKLATGSIIYQMKSPIDCIQCKGKELHQVTLLGGTDITISSEKVYLGNTRAEGLGPERHLEQVQAIVFRLSSSTAIDGKNFTAEDWAQKYLGSCAARIENGDCNCITSVGGATPDENGNINISLEDESDTLEMFDVSNNPNCGGITFHIKEKKLKKKIKKYGRCGTDVCELSPEELEAYMNAVDAANQEQVIALMSAPPTTGFTRVSMPSEISLVEETYPVQGSEISYNNGGIRGTTQNEETVIGTIRTGSGTGATFTTGNTGECGIYWDDGNSCVFRDHTIFAGDQSVHVSTSDIRTVDIGVMVKSDHVDIKVRINEAEIRKLTVPYESEGDHEFQIYLKDASCTEWVIYDQQR